MRASYRRTPARPVPRPRPCEAATERVNEPTAGAIRVVLAEEHRTLRRTLRALLDAAEGVVVAVEVSDLESAMRGIQRHQPHVLILDLRLPLGERLGSIRALSHTLPRVAIVMLTTEDSVEFARRVLDAGARGVVLKHHAEDDLLDAIRATAVGRAYVSPTVGRGGR